MQAPEPFIDPATLEAAQRHLADFVERTKGVVLALLSSADGLELVCYPRGLPIGQRLAAMGSSLHALSDTIVQEAGLPASRDLIIQSEGGAVVVLGIARVKKQRLALTVVAHGDYTFGQLLWAARDCGAQMQRQLFPSSE
jgi:predicted regulator of Ras-like GTPase activity (Roadblock/LC7/MglB family)